MLLIAILLLVACPCDDDYLLNLVLFDGARAEGHDKILYGGVHAHYNDVVSDVWVFFKINLGHPVTTVRLLNLHIVQLTLLSFIELEVFLLIFLLFSSTISRV